MNVTFYYTYQALVYTASLHYYIYKTIVVVVFSTKSLHYQHHSTTKYISLCVSFIQRSCNACNALFYTQVYKALFPPLATVEKRDGALRIQGAANPMWTQLFSH